MYGFFVDDESLAETSEEPGARRIEIFFKPPTVSTNGQNSALDIALVNDNTDRVYYKHDVGRAVSLESRDSDEDVRLQQVVARAAILRDIDGSASDVALKLSRTVGDDVDRTSLQTVAASFESPGATFNSGGASLIFDDGEGIRLDRISSLTTARAMADGRIDHLAPTSPTSALKILSQAKLAETDKIEHVTVVEPISTRPIVGDQFVRKVKLLALQVFRRDMSSSSPAKLLATISSTSTSYRDTNVKYGSHYTYRVHPIYSITVSALNEDTAQVVAAEFLLAGDSDGTVAVSAVDATPPPPPADLDARWDYFSRSLVLSWTFPVNRTRDIKYFQVFKRPSVDKPFQLLVEYDFNDSQVSPTRAEIILTGNNIVSTDPTLVYTDVEFKDSDVAIYAVGSVDAHGIVSTYSNQLEIHFDRLTNVLIKRQLSVSGAPRAYPNVHIESDMFVDVVPVVKKRYMRIALDPEYLRVLTGKGHSTDIIKSFHEGRYVIGLIDIDGARQLTATLKVKDGRS